MGRYVFFFQIKPIGSYGERVCKFFSRRFEKQVDAFGKGCVIGEELKSVFNIVNFLRREVCEVGD